MSSSLAVIILTYNETMHIKRALDSVLPIATEIFIIDSFSTDDTLTKAVAYGSRVKILQNPFVNQAKQFQWALDHAPISSEWVMRLDADEIIEADLAREIAANLPLLAEDVSGINLKRKTIFLGRWIKYGGRYPLTLLRIWRAGKAQIESRWMDEHIAVMSGRVVTFEGGFADHNLNDLTYFTNKHNKYATREAVEVINGKYRLFSNVKKLRAGSTSRQAFVKRYVKENLYNRLSFEVASVGYFIFRYFLCIGFLDGREGLAYHFLQCLWYRFLVGAKVREFDRIIRGLNTVAEKRSELARLTGLNLDELTN